MPLVLGPSLDVGARQVAHSFDADQGPLEVVRVFQVTLHDVHARSAQVGRQARRPTHQHAHAPTRGHALADQLAADEPARAQDEFGHLLPWLGRHPGARRLADPDADYTQIGRAAHLLA